MRQLSHLNGVPPGTNDCIGELGKQMFHGSFAPLTFCELPPGLVGSRFLDESQTQWTTAGDGYRSLSRTK